MFVVAHSPSAVRNQCSGWLVKSEVRDLDHAAGVAAIMRRTNQSRDVEIARLIMGIADGRTGPGREWYRDQSIQITHLFRRLCWCSPTPTGPPDRLRDPRNN